MNLLLFYRFFNFLSNRLGLLGVRDCPYFEKSVINFKSSLSTSPSSIFKFFLSPTAFSAPKIPPLILYMSKNTLCKKLNFWPFHQFGGPIYDTYIYIHLYVFNDTFQFFYTIFSHTCRFLSL